MSIFGIICNSSICPNLLLFKEKKSSSIKLFGNLNSLIILFDVKKYKFIFLYFFVILGVNKLSCMQCSGLLEDIYMQ